MISRLVMAAAVAIAASAAWLPALAQSVTSAPPPSENLTRLQERVDELEGRLRQATADSERLSIELRRAKNENTMLKRQLDDALAQQGAAPVGGAEPVTRPPAPASRVSPPRAAAPPPSAAGQLGTLPAGAAPGDSAQAFRDIRRLLGAGRYAEAEDALVEFIAAHPASADVPEARYFLGRVQIANGRNREALETFVALMKQRPAPARASDAWVSSGIAARNLGATEQACNTFRDLTRNYPNAGAATRDLAARLARESQCPTR